MAEVVRRRIAEPHIGRYSSTRGRVAETVNVTVGCNNELCISEHGTRKRDLARACRRTATSPASSPILTLGCGDDHDVCRHRTFQPTSGGLPHRLHCFPFWESPSGGVHGNNPYSIRPEQGPSWNRPVNTVVGPTDNGELCEPWVVNLWCGNSDMKNQERTSQQFIRARRVTRGGSLAAQ